ncbi:MAG: outer membrane lipoprotein-sorting protein, partial [Pseudobdellovibrionaceae bacterium]
MDQVYGGVVSYEIVLASKRDGFWKDPKVLNRLSGLARHLRQNAAVGSVVTLTDFFQGGIPQKKSQVAETFFLFSMAEKNPLSQIMTEDARQLRLMIRLKDQPSQSMSETRNWVKASARSIFPEAEIAEGGMAVTSHTINQQVSRELVFGFWHSLLLIGAFLVVMFRSVRWALVACLPNFIPPAILIASLALSQVPVKPGVALIFSIALGFAFNNTVYLLSRLKALMRTGKYPLKRAMLMESNPCFFESLVMMVGFSIFIFSSFSMNQIFGVFMMISIVAGFVADLFFLPAMLKLFPGVLKSSSPRAPEILQKRMQTDDEGDISPLKAAGILFAIISVGTLFSQQAGALEAKDILQKSRAQLDAQDDQAKVEMKIIEKNGEAKTRVIDLKTYRKNGFSVMAKIQSPADIKGMGFLGQIKNGKEAQWIFLPSSGQVRRVVTGKTKAGLLGSEISPEDLNSQAIKSSKVRIAKDDSQAWLIELTPAKGSSAYTRVVSLISKKDFLPQKTEYFVG